MGQTSAGGQPEVTQHRVIYLYGYVYRCVLMVDGEVLHDGDGPPSPGAWMAAIRLVDPSAFVLVKSGDSREIDLDIAQETNQWMHKL